MRAGEIKKELAAAGVGCADCFEKSELVDRLVSLRLNGPPPGAEAPPPPASEAPVAEASDPAPAPAVTPAPQPDSNAALVAELKGRCQAMRVKELRTELGERGLPWADALEKDELVDRLVRVLALEAGFSSSGRLRPGIVGQLTGRELEIELGAAGVPLLLDVFATWCGPCQMMAPQLEAAAKVLGGKVRVAKLDSDQAPDLASRLRVGALPTVILFDKHGKEVKRQEGALMEKQLLNMVESANLS